MAPNATAGIIIKTIEYVKNNIELNFSAFIFIIPLESVWQPS